MAVTRIKNNQVTDSSAGNTQVGINAATKIQDFSITAGKIANNLTYGSDLTVTGNLTVQGNSTAIDTTITTIEDPVIVLASTQTGAPAVDIGFIGERGSSENIAFVWDESAGEFVTVFTSTSETSTTLTITSYANAHVGNMIVGGTTSLIGNVIGTASFTGNVNAGNLNTVGTVSAASTVGGVITGTSTSVTGTQTAASTVGGVITGSSVSVTGNVSAANFIGNISGNVTSPGANTQVEFNDNGTSNATSGFTFDKTSNLVTVGGNVNATNFNGNVFGTSVSASGTVTAASTVGGVITGSSASVTGGVTAASVAGGVITGTSTSVTGTQTAASTVGGVITGSSASVTGGVTAASVAGGVITGTSTSVTGTQTAASTVGGVITGTSTSVTGTQTAASTVGGVITGTSTSVTGTQTAASTVGGVITGSSSSVTGNISGSNLNITGGIFDTDALAITTAAGDITLAAAGNISAGTNFINNVVNPTQDQDAATKIYVDNLVSTSISYHESVIVATTTNLAATTGGTVTYAQPNGVANGIGATLTTTGSFNLIDTANVQSANTRILVKDEGNATHNGVYVWSNATVITRSNDTNTYGAGNVDALGINDYFFTTSGNVNKGTAFVVDAPTGTITFGTSNIQFAIFSQSQVYSANTSAGLVLNGTVFSAKIDNDTTAFDGGGNIIVKAGANLTTPNIGAATGTSLSVTGSVTAASTVGGVITGTSVSVTGGVTAASVAGGVITGTSASLSGNVTGGNILSSGAISTSGTVTAASTVGGVITGSSVSVTGGVTAASVAGGVITGTSTSVTGTQTAASTVGGVITGSSASLSGNVTGGNILFGSGNVSGTGNVIASNFIGNISGNIDAAGANTQVQFNDGDLLGATAGFTFDKTSNLVTVGGNVNATNFNGNVFGTSVSASGTVTAASTVGGVITGSSASVTGTVTAASTVGGVITGSTASLTGNINGANLILSSGIIDGPAAGRITINGSDIDTDFAVDGDTLANVFYVDAGTGTASFGASTQVTNAIVNFATTTSIKTPVGNTAQRPAVGVTGMLRFNTTINAVEVYDNSQWVSVGTPTFTVIDDEQFNGDGSTVAFTLGSTQTTNSCIVSINGVVQIPTLAYSVAGTDPTCVLTFTEAPAPGDVIDVRQITTTTSVTSISNSSGNAVIATSPTAANVDVTGNLVISGTVSAAGFIGLDATKISNGTSNVSVLTSGGNIAVNVGGSGIVTFTSAGIINNMGNGVGNIGNATGYFNTVFALATSAQYADLAEKYTADADYAPGTVVMFGGSAEVTICSNDACARVAGVVSTNPSYRMNDGLQSAHTAMVALTGRVPTNVTGTVRKGDMMVSAGNGTARAEANPAVGTVIGKALADSEGDAVIEVVVGRV